MASPNKKILVTSRPFLPGCAKESEDDAMVTILVTSWPKYSSNMIWKLVGYKLLIPYV